MPSTPAPSTASSLVAHLLPSLLSPSPSPSPSSTASSSSSSTRSSKTKTKRRRSSLSSASLLSASSASTAATSLTAAGPPPAHQPNLSHHPQGSTAVPPGALVLSDGMDPSGTRIDRRAPRRIGALEGWWIWYQGTYVSSMLETWEFVLIHSLLLLLVICLSVALSYLPQHASLMAARVKYYVSGVGEWAASPSS
ncbi:hypothetical protein JCM6882_001614 [Rhodosporidiobolus microsporus]